MGSRFFTKKARTWIRAGSSTTNSPAQIQSESQVVPVASTTYRRLCQPLKFCICCVIDFLLA